MRKFWGEKTLCLVTGASQGIGKQIAVDFAKKLGEGSTMVLLARSKANLDAVREEIASQSPGVSVRCEVCDLSTADESELEGVMGRNGSNTGDHSLFLLVHNAGTEGNGQPAAGLCSARDWDAYLRLNVTSMAVLTGVFLRSVPPAGKVAVVNITSLAAVQPIKSMTQYCVGKAAREMFLRTLAEENPQIDIISYSPGPVRTEMIDRVISKAELGDTKDMFVKLRDTDGLVKPEDTIAKLITILEEGKYKSADHVDYFD